MSSSSSNSNVRDGSTPRHLLTSGGASQEQPAEDSSDYAGTPAEEPPSEKEIEDLASPNSTLALLRVFRHRNYRLFFGGQLITFMGTFVQTVAQGWLVYSLTRSSLLLGVTSFCALVPGFFLSPIAGTLSDRIDRRKVLITTRLLAMLQAAILTTLTLTGAIQVWHILALALLLGFVNGFDVPTRQAFVVEMVGREDLRHAISLNSVMFNLARIIGPTIGGMLVAAIGEGICFALNGVAAGAVLSSYFRMEVPPRKAHPKKHPLHELKEGFVYAWHTRQIRVALLLVAASSMFGGAYLTLMPAIARSILHEGPRGLGYLMASVGAGALVGAYALARIPDRHLPATPLIASASFGFSLILFSQSHVLLLSMALALPVAFSLVLLGGASNTIVQMVAEERLRGRVVSLYTMSAMGMMPWGSLLLGWLGTRIGVANAIVIGGSVCIAASAIAWFDRAQAGTALQVSGPEEV